MEWVEAVRGSRDPNWKWRMPTWSINLKMLHPIVKTIVCLSKNNIKLIQFMTGWVARHPVAPQVRIRYVDIPLRPDLAPEGLPASEATGTLKAEWQHYGGWFKKPPVNRSDGFVDPKERVILYAHGGIYCICSTTTNRGIPWRLGYHAGARVLCKYSIQGCDPKAYISAINYRLGPQSVYPAALHDMISAYFYLIDPPAGQPRYRPEQIMFGGDSAGGNLSVVTCAWLRDHPQNYPMPGGLLLISPWLDVSHSVPSFHGNGNHDYLPDQSADPKFINENRMHYFLPDNSRIYDPLISPIFDKENASKPFPPTMVHNGDAERVRDDCIVWASINKSSNIHIEMYEDMLHIFQYLTLVDSMATLSLHRLGAFADSVWRKQPWRAKSTFIWVRRNRSLVPLTRPMSIMEYGRQVCIALGVWSDQKQAVFDGVIQPLIDEEEREAHQPKSRQPASFKLQDEVSGYRKGDSISFDDWGFEKSQRGSYAGGPVPQQQPQTKNIYDDRQSYAGKTGKRGDSIAFDDWGFESQRGSYAARN